MISTLFFDESDSNTVLRVRPSSRCVSSAFTSSDAVALQAKDSAALPGRLVSFVSSGTIAVPALRAVLFWWVEGRGRDHLHLLAVNDDESARATHDSQSRMLSVALPVTVEAADINEGKGKSEHNEKEGRLLACGVAQLACGGHCVAVAWVSTTLEVGCLRVTLQRDTDARGSLVLTPEGSMMEGISLAPIQRTLSRDGGRGGGGFGVSKILSSVHTKGYSNALVPFGHWDSQPKGLTATPQSSGGPYVDSDYGYLHACVLSEIPGGSYDVVAVFVVTNGMSLWRAELHLDGSVQVHPFKENIRREETVNWFNEADLTSVAATPRQNVVCRTEQSPVKNDQKGWLGRFFNSSEKRRPMGIGGDGDTSASHGLYMLDLKYVAVTAVQNSSYVGLLRWNGMFELYDHDLNPLEDYPICPLPREDFTTAEDSSPISSPVASFSSTRVQQWASYKQETASIHVFTCIEAQKGRHFVWSRVPHLPRSMNDRFVMQCSYSVMPPVTSGFPIGCTVDAAERLSIIWGLDAEEDAHLMYLRSISSILHSACAVSGVLQILEAYPGPEKEWQWSTTRIFFCIGARLGGVVSHGAHLVLLEHRYDYHRAYVVQFARHWLQHLIEVKQLESLGEIVADTEPALAPSAEQALPPRTLCLVSSTDLDSKTAAVLHLLPSCTAFWEGWGVLQFATRGVEDWLDLLREAFKLPLIGRLPSLPRLLSDVARAGHVSSDDISEAMVRLAIREAMRAELQFSLPGISLELSMPSVLTSPSAFFFSYSRRYVLHAVLRELLNRIAFLVVTFVGWAGADAWGLESIATSALTRAIGVLVAAHHAVCVAGPELVCLVDAAGVEGTGDIVAQILQIFLYPAPYDPLTNATDLLEASRFAMRVAAQLRRAPGTRLFKAAVAWAGQLRHWYPTLQHYSLLHDLHAGRTTGSTPQLARCQAVCRGLSVFSDGTDLAAVLLDFGYLMSDEGHSSAFHALLSSPPQREALRGWIGKNPGLAVKLYAVGVLRRLVPTNSLVMHVSAVVVHRYYFVELLLVLQCVLACSTSTNSTSRGRCAEEETEGGAEEAGRPDAIAEAQESASACPSGAPSLQFALEELRIETLFCLSYASLTDFDFGSSFHDLEDAFNLSEKLGILSRYLESVYVIVDAIIECACTSEPHMEALLAVSTTTVRLDEVLVGKWYNYIARMPTKSSTEALRYRTILGLYRYLMHRHAYAQCGRVLSDIASLLRCSPLHRSAALSISVGELASMAEHAVGLIAVQPVSEKSSLAGRPQAFSAEEPATRKSAVGMPSPLSSGIIWHTSPQAPPGGEATSYVRRLLSPSDLPWLRRWVYQAHCEQKLWRRGNMLDCTDLWIDGAPREDFELAVKKLTAALVEARLWPEAYRFATLAEADACEVLEEWVSHLVQEGDLDDDAREEVLLEWAQLIDYCAEQSTLADQFMGYRRVVRAALSLSYTKTLPDLRDAHRDADPYSAITTLLEVFYIYQQRVDQEECNKDRDEESLEAKTFRRAQTWLPWIDAARIAIDLLQMSKNSSSSPRLVIEKEALNKVDGGSGKAERKVVTLTAGVLDPLARYGKELLQQPDVMRHLKIVKVNEIVRELLASISC